MGRLCSLVALVALTASCAEASGPGSGPAPTSTPGAPTTSAPTSPTTPATSRTAEPTPSRTARPTRPGTRIVVEDSEFGPMLFDATGQAIYLFDVERTTRPRCYGDCAVAWPPVLTRGRPVAGRGVRKGLLGTTRRTDGSVQVTYGGHPLYFYVNEGKREVLCHDVFLNGGLWYVVQPDGTAAPPG